MENSTKRLLKKWHAIAAIFFLAAFATNVQAQNVTVKSSNGSCIPSVKGEGVEDSFYSLGGFSLWKHNQLNLTMTTADSDGAAMSDIGQFENPANNIFKSSGDPLILGRGSSIDCYVALSLPKGYRFTGYTIVFRRNANVNNGGNGNASFGEADPSNSWGWVESSEYTTYVTGLSYSSSAARQTIKRESKAEDGSDMGNVLYFKLINSNGRAFITLESVELFFTAEADYTPVTPAGTVLNRTAVDIPFSTSTVDLGSIEEREYNGTTRISYSYENVKDLMGNLTLFEEESVTNGTNYDNISGKVVKYDDGGTISSQGNYFKVGRSSGAKQVYYIETPTYIEQNDNQKTKNPIGYRIIGAKINYSYGTASPAHTETVTEDVLVGTKSYPTFTISCNAETYSREWNWGWDYTSNGVQTYYLTSSAGMSAEEAQKAKWFIDDDGYIRLANNPDNYLKTTTVSGTSNRLNVVKRSESPAKYIVTSSGQITAQQNSNLYLCLSVSNYNNTDYPQTVNYFRMLTNSDLKATRTLTGEEKTVNLYESQTTVLDFPAFTPSNYKLTVYDATGENVIETVNVTSSTPDGYVEVPNMNNDAVKFSVEGVGLIKGELTLQALDPYIDRLNIVCHEADKVGNQYQVATTGRTLTQTFTASDFAVSGGKFYFFVPKDFEKDVLFQFEDLYSHYGDNTYYGNTTSKNNARYSFVKSPYWNSNADLYATTYDPDADYEDKVYTYLKGTQAFHFNNADEVGITGGTYQEYPFSLASYSAAGGDFNQLYYTNAELSTSETNPITEKIAYLFTCDETRYNIAPTTAIQHRIYAFYQMNILAEKKEYAAVFEWEKIYDKTLYRNGDDVKTDAQWGLKLLTEKDSDGEYGYLAASQVVFGIDDELDETGENAPKSKDQILYVDGSELLAIVEDTQATLADIKTGLATNVVVFLPVGTSSDQDNFASMTEGGTFRGNGNFVLTDMKPFYTPYDIQVPDANNATYTRLKTYDKYGKIQNASLIMPFAVTVDASGEHKNVDNSTFILHTMASGQTLEVVDNQAVAYFPAVSGVSTTDANKPYLVQLPKETDANEMFVVSQKAALIKASTEMDATDYTFTGAQATNVKATGGNAAGTYTFTFMGTYAGQQVPKANNIFYFANNVFVSSKDYRYNSPINVAPFRAYYASPSAGAKISSFSVSFEEGNGTDGIFTVDAAAMIDVNAPVYDLQGRMVAPAYREVAGKKLSSGIYVVNGVKFIVK